jgi:hypothetical protein
MKSNSSIKNMLLVVSLVLVVSISAFAITAESADAKVVEGKDVGDTFSFAAGSGKVVHNPGQDVCTYNTDSKVTLTLTVVTIPSDYNKGWDDVGTLTVTAIEFSANSDLIYIPAYIIDKQGSDIGIFKVTSISDSVKSEINEKTISIVLPQALKSESFGKSVTVVKEGSYTDTMGNVVHYSIDETGSAYMNGYGAYSLYSSAEAADYRYCEQGTVTKVDYAPGQKTYDTKMSQWAKNDLTSCDSWVCGLSWGDMIGTVLTYEVEFVGKGVTYSVDSLKCATNAVVSIKDNVLTVNSFTVTATPAHEEDILQGWSIADGDKITSDMEISANYESTASDNSGIYNAILVIIVAVIAAAIILHVIYHKKK